nr:hypothetical protein [Actinomycetota bacterium]
GLALAFGTAVAKDNPANKGDSKTHHRHHHKAAHKGSNNGPAQIADETTADNIQASETGDSTDTAQNGSFAFKGALVQDGTKDGPIKVKVEKASDAARSSVGKSLEFNVSPSTAIYRDNADAQNSNLDAKLSDLKAGDQVVIQAKGAQDATSFTASMISAEAPTPSTVAAPNASEVTRLAAKNPSNTVVAPNAGEVTRLAAKNP